MISSKHDLGNGDGLSVNGACKTEGVGKLSRKIAECLMTNPLVELHSMHSSTTSRGMDELIPRATTLIYNSTGLKDDPEIG